MKIRVSFFLFIFFASQITLTTFLNWLCRFSGLLTDCHDLTECRMNASVGWLIKYVENGTSTNTYRYIIYRSCAYMLRDMPTIIIKIIGSDDTFTTRNKELIQFRKTNRRISTILFYVIRYNWFLFLQKLYSSQRSNVRNWRYQIWRKKSKKARWDSG